MPQLPSPFRAAIGLAAEAVEQARHLPGTLPDKAIELPMLAVSTALQLSLRAQQRYAMLAARGDEILNHRETSDEPPPWATFDDPAPAGETDGSDVTDLAGEIADVADITGPDAQPPTKAVRPPRNGAPSRFDAVGDD